MLSSIPIIISAPAGTGKTSLVERLLPRAAWIELCPSYTTRLPRPGEKEGIDYHFVSEQVFLEKLDQGDFLEYVRLFSSNTYYGTCRKQLAAVQERGRSPLLVIEPQGADTLRKTLVPSPYSIFVAPPSLEVLEQRLRGRSTENEEQIASRLERAESELRQAWKYNFILKNDNFETCLEELVLLCKFLHSLTQPGPIPGSCNT